MESPNKHTDDLIKDLMKEQEWDMPSADFTSNVMGKLESKPKAAPVYESVISWKGWLLIVSLVGFVVVFSLDIASTPTTYEWEFPSLNFNVPAIELPFSIPFVLGISMVVWMAFVLDRYLSSKIKIE